MKRALSFFQSTIKKNRMAHLYLIDGPKGAGKLTLSYLVSAELLKRKGEDEQRLLNQIKNQIHPNVIVISPDGSVIKKEQILVLQTEFSKTSLVDGARIYIISDIEKISSAAANSLLKFLEEPEGKQTYGFLLTENRDAVLQTISSRSQHIHLVGIDKKEIKESLLNKGTNPLISEILPELTNNTDEALDLVNHTSVIEIARFLNRLAGDWLNQDIVFRIDYINLLPQTTQSRDWYLSFNNILLVFFTDVIRYKVHREITFESLRSEIQKISSKISLLQLEGITSFIETHINRQGAYIDILLYYQKLLQDLDEGRKLWK